jgi:glycosyltransferase involved in cell wall biosynthesis
VRVVHVHRIAGVGGSERHLLALLPALRGLGVDARLLGLDLPGAEPFYERLEAAGVPCFRLPSPRDLDPRLARSVVRSLRGLRPDLVHTHLVHADVYGGLAALRLGLPLVSTKHNDDPFRIGPFRYAERALTAGTRRVIAITSALARFCVERVGLPAAKVEVVRYGLDSLPEPWGGNPPVELPPGARVLLAVARLAPQKGLDVAVAALPDVLRSHPEAVLLVLGEGPERERLAAQAERLGAGDALLMPGRAGDVAPFLERADLFLHPARWEGFGLVLLEAMLAAKPVVATGVSAIPEIVVDGETGLLVPADDPAALAAAAARVLGDGDLAVRLGAAGLERARREFSVERMARETVAVYEAALSTRSAHVSTE